MGLGELVLFLLGLVMTNGTLREGAVREKNCGGDTSSLYQSTDGGDDSEGTLVGVPVKSGAVSYVCEEEFKQILIGKCEFEMKVWELL